MAISKQDSELLLQIATEKSQGGAYFRFSRLLSVFGHWSRCNVIPRGLYLWSDNRSKSSYLFKAPLEIFLLIDSTIAKYKHDPAYKAQYLAFDLFYLTAPYAIEVRRDKSAKLKRMLHSNPCCFLRDYTRAHTQFQELIRLDVISAISC